MSHDTELSPHEVNVDELQARLAEREYLVKELTSRLELAADQLDRVRRTGAGRGGHVVGGFPPELIEEQRALTESLQDAVQQWDDMQPTTLLARLEMQISELRDLVVDRVTAPAAESRSLVDHHSFSAAKSSSEVDEELHVADEDDKPPVSESSGLSTYELFKAGLAAESGDSAALPNSRPASKPPQNNGDSAESRVEAVPVVEQPTVVPPTAIDFDSATEEELREAVDQRDSYITYLLRKLRIAESAGHISGNWSELENVPDELRTRLEEHEARLQESLRRAEIETSMERARLGREANRLELWEEQLRKKAAQLGLSKDEAAADGDGEDVSPKKRRWLRMFGKKSAEES